MCSRFLIDTTTSTGSDNTSPSTVTGPQSGNNVTVIIGVIVVITLLLIVAVVIAIVAILCLRLKKKRTMENYNTELVPTSVVNNSNGTQGETDFGTDDDKRYPPLYYSSNNANSTYQIIASKEHQSEAEMFGDAGVCDGVYSQVDCDDNVYNKLNRSQNEVREGSNNSSNNMYSRFDDKKYLNVPVTSMSSTPGRSHDKTDDNLPLYTYATVDTSRIKSSKNRECEKIGEEAPRILEKTPELQQYLDTKVQTIEQQEMNMADDTYTVPSLTGTVSTLSKNLTSVCHGKNPLYEFGSMENVYAEADTPSAVPSDSTQQENIYESIYSESLRPSHFMQDPKGKESEDALCPYSSIYTVPLIVASQQKVLEISKENIQAEETLGSGHFGKVILAKTVGLSLHDLKMGKSTDKTISVPVAVKMLKTNASESSKVQFEKEYRFMFRLNHPNVIRLLGICLTETPFIMMEYMDKGDLNKVLKQYHGIVGHNVNPREGEITQQMLIQICTQIASGMNYLASNNFIHRDLATRNCLVGENFFVKIADFGMSHNLYGSHYYIIHGHAVLPVRWMATECFYGKFSAKTDVWSFGVTMWEIFVLAKYEPYYKMNDADLVENALTGSERLILSCPERCPRSMYEIMKGCWAHNASERLTFEQLHEKLLYLL